jgi:hypothetical protein
MPVAAALEPPPPAKGQGGERSQTALTVIDAENCGHGASAGEGAGCSGIVTLCNTVDTFAGVIDELDDRSRSVACALIW